MTDRLQQLSDAGVSIWLDDLSRERIETGNLADLVKNDHVVGVTTNPSIFAAALAEGERYDAQVRELAADGADVDQAVFGLITTDDVRDACDVCGRSSTPPTASTAGSRSRSPPAWPTTPTRTVASAAGALEDGRPAQPAASRSPATDRGLPGDHRDPGRGHQRQRHADLRPRPVPRRHGGLPRRPREGPRERPRPVHDPLGRVVLRLPRRHRDRQAARRRLGAAPTERSRARPASPTRAWPTRPTRSSSPATAGTRSRPPAPTGSARCGPRPASRTPTTATRCTSTTWSSRTP